eukprot:TRINITY_DN11287_c0_g1_i1.p1 TRINITY_DN11287_c0_g1~~TRINITY_DN11287_c0_g1_i1.p1  ORF type:complete len:656 (+),score=92.14 TRINITY_DN11287_c0_g1_i1:94-2061(+)
MPSLVGSEMCIRDREEIDPPEYQLNFTLTVSKENRIGGDQLGNVYRVSPKNNPRTSALKIINVGAIDNAKRDLFEKTLEQLLNLEDEDDDDELRKNLVLIEIFEFQSDHLLILMEFCKNGNLADHLKRQIDNRLTENEAKTIMFKIIQGYLLLHYRGIMHGNIRKNNILLRGKDWKLSDYGLADLLGQSGIRTRPLVQEIYMAPEDLECLEKNGALNTASEASDIWAMGAIFYEMTQGCLPFILPEKVMRESPLHVLRKNVDLSFRGDVNLSEEGKNLIRRMLVKDAKTRVTLQEIVKSKYWDSIQLNVKETLDKSIFRVYQRSEARKSSNASPPILTPELNQSDFPAPPDLNSLVGQAGLASEFPSFPNLRSEAEEQSIFESRGALISIIESEVSKENAFPQRPTLKSSLHEAFMNKLDFAESVFLNANDLKKKAKAETLALLEDSKFIFLTQVADEKFQKKGIKLCGNDDKIYFELFAVLVIAGIMIGKRLLKRLENKEDERMIEECDDWDAFVQSNEGQEMKGNLIDNLNESENYLERLQKKACQKVDDPEVFVEDVVCSTRNIEKTAVKCMRKLRKRVAMLFTLENMCAYQDLEDEALQALYLMLVCMDLEIFVQREQHFVYDKFVEKHWNLERGKLIKEISLVIEANRQS